MKPSSRILIVFGSAIAVLIIVTVVLVLTLGQGSSVSLPQNSPEGAVQRYLQAVQDKDYANAYSLLTPPASPTPDGGKPVPPQDFQYYVMSAQNAASNTWKANLGKVTETGSTATVDVSVEVFRPSGPFGNQVNTNNVTFFLKKVGSGWLITAPLDLYWLY